MTDTCSICKKPILNGEARYTVGEFSDPPVYRHYECWDAQRRQIDRDLRRAGKSEIADMLDRLSLNRIRKRPHK